MDWPVLHVVRVNHQESFREAKKDIQGIHCQWSKKQTIWSTIIPRHASNVGKISEQLQGPFLSGVKSWICQKSACMFRSIKWKRSVARIATAGMWANFQMR